mmetsp:Transcript_62091/g.173381  ORF Transcript_62091/g.173381 Transcript_62091/m.173381 type:complete len:283 (-) Transcript_62091:819-1667(-)
MKKDADIARVRMEGGLCAYARCNKVGCVYISAMPMRKYGPVIHAPLMSDMPTPLGAQLETTPSDGAMRRLISSRAARPTEAEAMLMPMMNLPLWPRGRLEARSMAGSSTATMSGVATMMARQSAMLKKDPESWKLEEPNGSLTSIWQACCWYQNCMALYTALKARLPRKSGGTMARKARTSSTSWCSSRDVSAGDGSTQEVSTHGATTARVPRAAVPKAMTITRFPPSGTKVFTTERTMLTTRSTRPPQTESAILQRRSEARAPRRPSSEARAERRCTGLKR